MNDFEPKDHDREPREEGWKEETERICELLHKRGDLRIGQLIINAVTDYYSESIPEFGTLDDIEDEDISGEIEKRRNSRKAAVEQLIWSLEADELLEALKHFLEEE